MMVSFVTLAWDHTLLNYEENSSGSAGARVSKEFGELHCCRDVSKRLVERAAIPMLCCASWD